MNGLEARESGPWRLAVRVSRGLWCLCPSARVAHRLDHLPDRRDDLLRLVLVDVVPALGSDGVVRVGDELGEILLQRGHDPFHLVALPARRWRVKWDAVG